MNNKQQSEINFWKGLYEQLGEDKFNELRKADLKEKTKHFKDLMKEKGEGIDIGCGFKSIFEHSKLKMKAVDPLLDEYKKIADFKDTKNIKYKTADCEKLPFKKKFDFAVCINVLDHTPNPDKLLKEIKRLVKKGGKLYFQVNFDFYLAGPHYSLYNEDKIKEQMKDFKLLYSEIEENHKDNQNIYNAVYEV